MVVVVYGAGWFLCIETTYRVTNLVCENFQLPWIWVVLPSCLARSVRSQGEVFNDHIGHPVRTTNCFYGKVVYSTYRTLNCLLKLSTNFHTWSGVEYRPVAGQEIRDDPVPGERERGFVSTMLHLALTGTLAFRPCA